MTNTHKWLPVLACSVLISCYASAAESPREFHVWATSCAHVPADIRRGRESLAKVIRQSEGLVNGAPAFGWDIMLDAGDLSAHQTPPGDKDGMELIRQYQVMTKHRREQIYNVPGNHDAPYYDHGPGSWIRKWGDPLGENTEFSGVDRTRRPFAVEGTWERYKFQAGNILFLMLADRNDAPEPVGRGHSSQGKSGGYPAGAVTRDTFNWWKKQVLDNQDKIIVTMHHHALRDTTVASGKGEGNPRYHGSSGGAEGSSYLYYLIENDDPKDFKYTADAHVFEDFLDEFHKEHGRGAIDLWIGGHTHVKSPDDNWGGKTISERRWGVGFLQVAALTKHHGGSTPLSRLLKFADGRAEFKADVYLHEPWFKDNPVGVYKPASITWSLRHKFIAPPPIQAMAPFPKSARVFTEPYVGPKSNRKAPVGAALIKAAPSPDLTSRWDATNGGKLNLEAALLADTSHAIGNKPRLVTVNSKDALGLIVPETPSPRPSPPVGERVPEGRVRGIPGSRNATASESNQGLAMKFDGQQRVRIGRIDMEDWTDLTVSAWINTTNNSPNMRIVSKDDLGEPGNFVLLHTGPGVWLMRAWDDRAKKWQAATWRSNGLSNGRWHHLAGVVDSRAGKIRLFVNGELKAEAPWTADTLDDSDKTDLVVGADSGKKSFGHTFTGMIRDVQVYPRALKVNQFGATDESSTPAGPKLKKQ